MTTRTIDTLLEIIGDTDYATHRRVEAAEAILGFESPADAVARAREYLMSVFENREEAIGDRMDALKISQKFGSKKIAPQTVHITRREETDRREAWRTFEIWDRKRRLIAATNKLPPANYADDLLSDEYLPPPGAEWPPTTVERDPASGFRVIYNKERR
jgi:hypothetical protein